MTLPLGAKLRKIQPCVEITADHHCEGELLKQIFIL